MKRLICLVLMLLLVAPAFAAPQLSDSLFYAAKQAAAWLAAGDYESLARLPFSGAAPDAEEWASFAANYATRGTAQQEYAVGYWLDGGWRVAVPLREPDGDDVEVLLLTSEDGYAFSGYRYALWGQVRQEWAAGEHVVWNSEYLPAVPRVFAD